MDHHLRKLYASLGGVDVFVTEFIRITNTVLPARVFYKYCPELLDPIGAPVRVQLLGSNPEVLALNAYKVASLGAVAIDLNFGCPAKTVNRHRGGACLLNEPQLLYKIVSSVRKAVPSDIEVTAKIRLGYEQRMGFLDTAKAIMDAGASEIVVHARSKEDGYKPPAYWDCIALIKNALTIPVIANGEIWTVSDYLNCRSQSLCRDVMLGRGLLATPDLALAIKANLSGVPHTHMHWGEVLPLLYELHRATVDSYPSKFCGNRVKQWLMYLKRTYSQANDFFEAVKRTRSPEEIAHCFAQAA